MVLIKTDFMFAYLYIYAGEILVRKMSLGKSLLFRRRTFTPGPHQSDIISVSLSVKMVLLGFWNRKEPTVELWKIKHKRIDKLTIPAINQYGKSTHPDWPGPDAGQRHDHHGREHQQDAIHVTLQSHPQVWPLTQLYSVAFL